MPKSFYSRLIHMDREEAIRRATAVLMELNREGIQPFDEIGWMNPEDVAAIIEPFADVILHAYQMGLKVFPQ